MAADAILKIVQWPYLSRGLSDFDVAVAFRNGLQYRHFDLKRFICDDLAIQRVKRS